MNIIKLPEKVTAEIIAVGTELLLGQILNTNAQFLSVELSKLGIDVYFQTVVGDNACRLEHTLNTALDRSDIVILTGGLGPTQDDLTKETTAKVLGLPLELHQGSMDRIKNIFCSRNRVMTQNNQKQAYLPRGCIVLPNDNGTAPGCIVERAVAEIDCLQGKTATMGDKIIIMLPGPPSELVPMFNNYAAGYLHKKSGQRLYSKVLKIFGIGESELESRIIDIIDNQSNPTIAPYAKDGEVTLRITAKAECQQIASRLISDMEDSVYAAIGSYIYGQGDDTLESVVCGMLMEKSISISSAESCTGGMLAGKITSVSGISKCFGMGAVTYCNQSKINLLGVKAGTLDKYGAVSSQTAIEMAEGIRKISGSDIGVSTTGIAGPTGATPDKPIGLVYIGWSYGELCGFKQLRLGGSRDKVRNLACMYALDCIKNLIDKT